MDIRLVITIPIESLTPYLKEELVDSKEELEIIYKSQAKKDIVEFIDQFPSTAKCESLKIEE